jgi:hypothetical protein
MKKRILFLMLWVCIGLACKKSNIPNSALMGTWQWNYSIGGIAGQTITPMGNIVVLRLQPDSVFSVTVNGVQQTTGLYHTKVDSANHSILYLQGILAAFPFASPNGLVYQIQNNQLICDDHQVSDGFRHYFGRIGAL